MKLEITAEWLKSWDDDISDPAPYATHADIVELARRKEEWLRSQSPNLTIGLKEAGSREELFAAAK